MDLTEIVNDTELNAQPFSIQRSTGGAFGPNGWIDNSTTIAGFGIIQPASAEDLAMLPEGDRVTAGLSIICQQQLYRTRTGSDMGISDVITWHGQTYRVISCTPWLDYGFWKAIATKMTPSDITNPAS